jgi:hypothetical protein
MFTPQRQPITDITKALPAVVTTAQAHGLTTGQAVRINVPKSYGMFEIGGKIYQVTVLSTTTFSLQYDQVPPADNVDSTEFTTFVIPPNPGMTAEMLPVGAKSQPVGVLQSQSGNCASLTDDAWINNSTVEIPY